MRCTIRLARRRSIRPETNASHTAGNRVAKSRAMDNSLSAALRVNRSAARISDEQASSTSSTSVSPSLWSWSVTASATETIDPYTWA